MPVFIIIIIIMLLMLLLLYLIKHTHTSIQMIKLPFIIIIMHTSSYYTYRKYGIFL